MCIRDRYNYAQMPTHVAADIGPYLAKKWSTLADHPIVGETRTLGMLAALELVRDKPSRARIADDAAAASDCRNRAIESGVMIRAVGDAIISAPPLVSTHEEIDLLIERLTQALDGTARHYGINTTA